MPISVIVVGAGPSGLLMTLLLARAGIPVELLERARGLDDNPRATHYPEAACFELDRAGVLEAIRAEGFSPETVSWRKLDAERTRLAGVGKKSDDPDSQKKLDKHRMACLPLHKLGRILEAAVAAEAAATIRYGHKVVDVGQGWVKVEVEGEDEPRVLEADYIVGCDGANSTVRRCLAGGKKEFPGHTWDEQLVATNVYYDFAAHGYDDSQFFVDREHWHMVAKIQADGLYRVTYGEAGGLTTEELRARLPAKFRALLPGDQPYKLVGFSPYRVHQRCVDRMRVGRVLLAADAAHLCNPFGGLGLTGGIADVGSLYDSLLGIHTGRADDSILDRYDEERRRIWHEVINPLSTSNMRRLIDDAEEALKTDPFLRMLRQMEEQPGEQTNPSHPPSLRHDMTQYYKG